MMKRRNLTGLTLGILFGLMHTVWVSLVGLGLAQPVIDGLESWHFISSQYTVTGFDGVTALLGVIAAFISGYVIGWTYTAFYKVIEQRTG